MTLQCQATGYSVRGARHVLTGTPCQDAVMVKRDEKITIIAAADGHGDSKHPRSAEGAQMAVEVVVELLDFAMKQLLLEGPRHPEQIESALRMHLPRRISWEWNRRVKMTAGTGMDGTWHDSLILFGSTIMGAAFSDELALFVQLGDGDMLLLNEAGDAQLVFDLDEDLYGSLTHSLCQPNIAMHANVACKKIESPRLFLLSTDGLRDSLQGDQRQFERVGRWFEQRVNNLGWDKVNAELPQWLKELSERGNGDDATVGLVFWGKEKTGV